MKIENNLLNISMSQSDRVQEPSKPDSSSSSPKASAHGGGGRCRSRKSGGVGRGRPERGSGPSGRASSSTCAGWSNPVSIKWIALP